MEHGHWRSLTVLVVLEDDHGLRDLIRQRQLEGLVEHGRRAAVAGGLGLHHLLAQLQHGVGRLAQQPVVLQAVGVLAAGQRSNSSRGFRQFVMGSPPDCGNPPLLLLPDRDAERARVCLRVDRSRSHDDHGSHRVARRMRAARRSEGSKVRGPGERGTGWNASALCSMFACSLLLSGFLCSKVAQPSQAATAKP